MSERYGRCYRCQGKGVIELHYPREETKVLLTGKTFGALAEIGSPPLFMEFSDCPRCNGTGHESSAPASPLWPQDELS